MLKKVPRRSHAISVHCWVRATRNALRICTALACQLSVRPSARLEVIVRWRLCLNWFCSHFCSSKCKAGTCKVVWGPLLVFCQVLKPLVAHQWVHQVTNMLKTGLQLTQTTLFQSSAQQSWATHAKVWNRLPFTALYAAFVGRAISSRARRWDQTKGRPTAFDPLLPYSCKYRMKWSLCLRLDGEAEALWTYQDHLSVQWFGNAAPSCQALMLITHACLSENEWSHLTGQSWTSRNCLHATLG